MDRHEVEKRSVVGFAKRGIFVMGRKRETGPCFSDTQTLVGWMSGALSQRNGLIAGNMARGIAGIHLIRLRGTL